MKQYTAEQCRFFTGEEAMAWAIKAYLAASRELTPPKGESWWQDGMGWAEPGDFAVMFVQHLVDRLARRAYDLKLYPPKSQLARDVSWPQQGEPWPDLGGFGLPGREVFAPCHDGEKAHV